jgi:hypothetical protein
MNHFIDSIFDRNGHPTRLPAAGPTCPSDEIFASYLGALLPAGERDLLETHALACFPCHELLRTIADMAHAAPPLVAGLAPAVVPVATQLPSAAISPPPSVRIIGRMAARGIELLNHLELTFRTLVDGPLTPALGTLRRADTRAPAVSEWLCVRGPGQGLDELELQTQADGTVRLLVRCDRLPDLQPGETASLVLEVDGATREKRAFTGEAMSFAPLSRGSCRLRLMARAPGTTGRALAEATIQLES